MSITIRDVAEAAGVSVATVSRVLNNSGPVHARTRQRVERAASRLRYSPHGTARSLITRRTNVLGVVLPDLSGEFFSEVVRGMDRAAQQAGYHLLVSSSHDELSQIEFALQAMSGRVDGMIVMSPDVSASDLARSIPERTRVVLLNCEATGSGFYAINIDNFGGAYTAVRHLIDLGHTRVAMIAGGPANFDSRQRLLGYQAALRDAGIEAATERVVTGDFTKVGGFQAALELISSATPPTAIFAANDSMAVGALSAIAEAGLRVPEDMAVVGFDDIPIARFVSPQLTTVQVDVRGLGSRAVELLLESLGKETLQPPTQESLPATLVVRRSCGGRPSGEPVDPDLEAVV